MSKFLHIHGQRRPGNPANLVGTREGLVALRDAIDRALSGDRVGDAIAHATIADGGEYKLFVKMRPDGDVGNSYWDKAAVPYGHPADRERRPDAVFPWNEVWTQTPRRVTRNADQIAGCNAAIRHRQGA